MWENLDFLKCFFVATVGGAALWGARNWTKRLQICTEKENQIFDFSEDVRLSEVFPQLASSLVFVERGNSF